MMKTDFKTKRVKVADIIPYENNPRRNEDAVDPVGASMEQFGYKVPIVVTADNVIITGHTRLKALKKAGIDEVTVIVADDLTDEQARAFRLADNKTAELAGWDFEALDIELFDIDKIDMEQFGFDHKLTNGDVDVVGGGFNILEDKFLIPPFDIFDARSRRWLDRKKAWNERIGDTGQARANAKAYENKGFNKKDTYRRNGTQVIATSILDPVLSEIACKWFAPDGGKCFDCFAGDAVFGYVSASLGHEFTGIEIRREQCDFNTERVAGLPATYICDDGRNVLNHIKPESQDLLFSCPPYYDLEVYSDLEGDASNQETYEDFYAIIDKAFTDSVKCLKNNRFVVVTVGDIRDKSGVYYNFPNDVINTFKRNGLALYNNIKLLTPIGTAAIRAGRYMRNRKTVHVYQDVLVFYKGDPRQIKEHFGEIEVENVSEDMEL